MDFKKYNLTYLDKETVMQQLQSELEHEKSMLKENKEMLIECLKSNPSDILKFTCRYRENETNIQKINRYISIANKLDGLLIFKGDEGSKITYVIEKVISVSNLKGYISLRFPFSRNSIAKELTLPIKEDRVDEVINNLFKSYDEITEIKSEFEEYKKEAVKILKMLITQYIKFF